jgi:anthranilate synthase/aminodeoxychorismate synthase-like glutamine amidotransferase
VTLVIDNYDSFTYNLVQYLQELGETVIVIRNNEWSIDQIQSQKMNHILISPGPCSPTEAGISVDIVRHFAGKIPILGVCLGHQSIGYAFGGKIIHAQHLMHGKTSQIQHDGQGVFKDIPNPFKATRYHSLAIDRHTLPDCLKITATSEDGEIMGVRHRHFLLEGVQFHPESILTEFGKELLKNFLSGGL